MPHIKKIKELHPKIKEIKKEEEEPKEEDESLSLEQELEKETSGQFKDFMSSGEMQTPILESGQEESPPERTSTRAEQAPRTETPAPTQPIYSSDQGNAGEEQGAKYTERPTMTLRSRNLSRSIPQIQREGQPLVSDSESRSIRTGEDFEKDVEEKKYQEIKTTTRRYPWETR